MTDHKSHQSQTHTHGTGHLAGGKVHAHKLDVDKTNPAVCTPKHACGAHATDHVHGAGCKHEAVPHGDHTDYVVSGHLHHPCDKHCDDHGPVSITQTS
jgi:hypothetical protein